MRGVISDGLMTIALPVASAGIVDRKIRMKLALTHTGREFRYEHCNWWQSEWECQTR